MSGITAYLSDNAKLGYYRIFAQAPGSNKKTEITFFRGAPISVSSLTHADPFGDKSASITVPNVTIYDRLGSGDLEWLAPWSKIDIVWEPDSELDSVTSSLLSEWSWEGVIASWSFKQDSSSGSVTIECVGALYVLDNILAMPFYPSRPIPFEELIKRIFKRASAYGYGLGDLFINYDPAECMVYHSANYRFGSHNPAYLNENQLWSGFSTKASGNKDKALTTFIAGLLSQMYSTTGKQWTLMNKKDRMSELKVRKYRDEAYIKNNSGDFDVLYIDAVTPGVSLNLNQDYSQTANVIYGTGTTPEGRKFSTPSGNTVYAPVIPNTTLDYLYYEQNPQPFAIQKSVQDINDFEHNKTIRKELNVEFQPGINADQAESVALRKLDLVKDPGYSGSITLSVDPELGNGFVFPRYLIEAGKTIVLYYGDATRKFIFSISEVSLNIETGDVSLTVDSRNKDLITVDEVRARRGDALNIIRRLSTNMQGNDIPQADYLRPWNGIDSGKMPLSSRSKELFNRIDYSGSKFPWTDVTTKMPPRTNPEAYVKLGPTNTSDPTNNWAGPVKVLLSAKGTIGTTQIAAYKSDGTLFPAEFHVSFYLAENVKPAHMPQIDTRRQNFQRYVAKVRWDIPTSSVVMTFTDPHGLSVGDKGWKVFSSFTDNWAPSVDQYVTVVDTKSVSYTKSAKPSGKSPVGNSIILQKITYPKQRASIGTNTTNTVSYYSQYTIDWVPNAGVAQAGAYKVSIFVGDSVAKNVSSKIASAVSKSQSPDDMRVLNPNTNITVSGSLKNPSINGSFALTSSTERGTLEYYLADATLDMVSGTYSENIYVEIDIATTGEDPGNYPVNKPYPFYEWAFQTSFTDGTSFENTTFGNNQNYFPVSSAQFVMGWGNYWQPAGYGNGLASQGSPKVGTLIDEAGWSYDTTDYTEYQNRNVLDLSADLLRKTDWVNTPTLGYVYAMIYCDDQGADDIYFLGRMYPAGE